MSDSNKKTDQLNKSQIRNEERRNAVRNILAGSGVVAGAAAAPAWVKPAIEAIVLPAHAQTSGPLVFPKVLVGNALAQPIAQLNPVQQKNSVLDMFIDPAYAGGEYSYGKVDLEGACLEMDIPDDESFLLTITFADQEPVDIEGTISANGMISGSGSGIEVDGMADFQANTATGTISNLTGSYQYELGDDIQACIPVSTTTTTQMPSTTTEEPTTTTPCPTGYTYAYGYLGDFYNYNFPYDINGNNPYGYGYSCFEDAGSGS